MRDDTIGASMKAMFDERKMLPIYVDRLEDQLQLVRECLKLLQRANQFIDDGSETQGFWAMSLKERTSFCDVSRKILHSLNLHIKEQINQADMTSEMSTLMMKAMRYDARLAMEEGQWLGNIHKNG